MKLTLYKRGNIPDALIYINGKRVDFTDIKATGGEPSNQRAELEVEKEVTVEAYSLSPLLFKNWALKALFFWICGIFGLVSPRYLKRAYSLEYAARFSFVKDTTVVIEIKTPMASTYKSERAVNVYMPISDLAVPFVPIEEEGELGKSEPLARKRRTRISVFTWLFWILAIAGVGALTLFWIINH